MKTDRTKLIAAGLALATLPEGAAVAAVSVDGGEVDVAAARKAATEALAVRSPEAPTSFDRVADKLEAKVKSAEEQLSRTRIGRAINDFIRADPERVSAKVLVEIRLESGERIQVPQEAMDPRATAILQKLSMMAEIASLVPIVGTFAIGAASLAAGIASLISWAVGQDTLARALAKTAGKHLVMLPIMMTPVLGYAASALAALIDRGDLKQVREAPSVSDVVNLGRTPAEP